MNYYLIENTRSGHVFGVYKADSEAEALDILARDAGYRDRAHALEVTGGDGNDVIATAVPFPDCRKPTVA